MSAPVLAFSNPKKQRRQKPSERGRVSSFFLRKIIEFEQTADAADVTMLEDMLDLLLAQARKKRLPAGNIGKPVITIDRDDREGA